MKVSPSLILVKFVDYNCGNLLRRLYWVDIWKNSLPGAVTPFLTVTFAMPGPSMVRQLVRYTYPNCPRTIVCIGRNYTDHIKELGNTSPSEPFFFLKPPGALLLPPNNGLLDTVCDSSNKGQILMPKDCGLHHEVELAVVLKQTLDEWRGGTRELSNVVEGYAVGEFDGNVW